MEWCAETSFVKCLLQTTTRWQYLTVTLSLVLRRHERGPYPHYSSFVSLVLPSILLSVQIWPVTIEVNLYIRLFMTSVWLFNILHRSPCCSWLLSHHPTDWGQRPLHISFIITDHPTFPNTVLRTGDNNDKEIKTYKMGILKKLS